MSWIKNLLRYRDERRELIRLREHLADLSDEFRQKGAGLKVNSDDYQSLLADYADWSEMAVAAIAKIETSQMLRRAEYWRVPVPPRPLRGEEDTEFWEWSRPHGTYYLSDVALSHLRREAYQEFEMRWKPWLAWMAIIISIVSLVVSVFRP